MIPKINCLDCNHALYDNKTETKVECGDVFICVYCGCIMEFNKNLKPKRPKQITSKMVEASLAVKGILDMGLDPEQVFLNKVH